MIEVYLAELQHSGNSVIVIDSRPSGRFKAFASHFFTKADRCHQQFLLELYMVQEHVVLKRRSCKFCYAYLVVESAKLLSGRIERFPFHRDREPRLWGRFSC